MMLNLLFAFIFLANLILNIDHGLLPASTVDLKKEIDLSNLQLGVLGSLVFGGLTFGSALAPYIFQKISHKSIIVVSTFMLAVFSILFTLTNSFVVMCLARALQGFFQIFLCIYFPVWVDTYGLEHNKTIWLTVLLLGPPLGVVLGYIIGAMVTYWRFAFYVHAAICMPCFIFFLLTPSSFFNSVEIEKEGEVNQGEVGGTKEFNMFDSPNASFHRETLLANTPLFLHRKKTSLVLSEIMTPKGKPTSVVSSFKQRMREILRNVPFVLTALSLSGLYFIITGVQFWISDYFVTILFMP